MATIARFRLPWSGFTGGPGLMTVYSDTMGTAGDLNPPMHTLLTAFNTYLPTVVHIDYPTATDLLDDSTGALTGASTAAAQSQTVGFASGAYSAPVGFAVRWETGHVADGRRIRGHSYFVPAAQAVQSTSGAINSGIITTLNAALATFVAGAGSHMVIWHRPKHDKAPPHALIRPGTSFNVISGVVLPQMVVLRSRRD